MALAALSLIAGLVRLETLSYVVAVYLVFLCFQPLKVWRYRKIPGPLGLPLLGNLIPFAKKGGHEYLLECAHKYGPVFKIWFGTRVWVVTGDPDAMRRAMNRLMLRVPFPYLGRSNVDDTIATSGLVQANGELWRKVRNAWQPFFQPGNLSTYTPLMNSCTNQLLERLSHHAELGSVVDIWGELGEATLAVVGSAGFGVDLHPVTTDKGSQQGKELELVQALRIVMSAAQISNHSLYLRIAMLIPDWAPLCRLLGRLFPDKKLRHARSGVDRVRTIAMSIIQDQVKGTHQPYVAYKEGSIIAVGSELVESQQQGILDQPVEDTTYVGPFIPLVAQKLSILQVLSSCVTFLFGGYETSANALSMAVYNICRTPDAEHHLLQEIDSFGRDRQVTHDDLQHFPYAEAVIKETLRLNGPVPFTNRETAQDADVGGYSVPKGTNITMLFWAVHHDALHWPEPWSFQPERFMPGGQAESVHPGAYVPFGGGARMCVGMKFAMMEAKLVLVRLYQRFVFRLEGGADAYPPTKFALGFTLSPIGGVRVNVLKRS